MDSKGMNQLLKAILIRGEQLANVEGAMGTASLLQITASLINYFSDAHSWGSIGDELHAMQDYGDILRSCFGYRVNIACPVPRDQFIRRRVLLNALLDVCSPDTSGMDESWEAIDIHIDAKGPAEDGNLYEIRVRFEGNGAGESVVRTCQC